MLSEVFELLYSLYRWYLQALVAVGHIDASLSSLLLLLSRPLRVDVADLEEGLGVVA